MLDSRFKVKEAVMIEVKRALISTYYKEGILDFAKSLVKHDIKLLATHGTAKLLKEEGIAVEEIAQYIRFPEILGGRVKTLHPKIHAGILARRDNESDMEELREAGIEPIDMVIINLYPFQEVIKKEGINLNEVIEFIDIGGPTMIRAAAKNYKYVVVVPSPKYYDMLIKEIEKNGGISEATSFQLAKEAFYLTSHYDSLIANYLEQKEEERLFPDSLIIRITKKSDLRYGENPHQKAALYEDLNWKNGIRIVDADKLHGKELSFNNWLDLDSALNLVIEFDAPCACIVKHNNPCGIALAKDLATAFRKAYQCDPLSAFGGIVALNNTVDEITADAILSAEFLECIIAPDYNEKALEMLKTRKNLRIMALKEQSLKLDSFDMHRIRGGFLLQEWDHDDLDIDKFKQVTTKTPTENELKTLLFAWKAVKNVKSNAILLAKDFAEGCYASVGIGMGQTSRVDAVIIACRKAGQRAKNAVLASDAFFPKADAIEVAHNAGITAIIQPGGSIRDQEVIEKCNQLGIAMVFTSLRHFKH